jgi:hypothetical protein
MDDFGIAVDPPLQSTIDTAPEAAPGGASERTFEFDSGAPFRGVLDHLMRTDPSSFEVTSSSGDSPEVVCSLSELSTSWQSGFKLRDPFIQFNFDRRRLALRAYSLQAADSADDRHPSVWLVAGSNDQEEWAILDEQVQNWDLRGRGFTTSCVCDGRESDDAFKFIHFQMPEPNFEGDWTFRLARIELFGTLVRD